MDSTPVAKRNRLAYEHMHRAAAYASPHRPVAGGMSPRWSPPSAAPGVGSPQRDPPSSRRTRKPLRFVPRSHRGGDDWGPPPSVLDLT